MEIIMYEPTFVPKLSHRCDSLSNIKFTAVYSNDYLTPEDPRIDPFHIHDYTELFFNLSEEVSFLVNNNVYSIGLGEAVVSLPGDVHRCIFNRSGMQEHVCIWIDAPVDSAISFLKDSAQKHVFSDEERKTVISLVKALAEACKSDGREINKASLLFQILAFFENSEKNFDKSFIPEAVQSILDDINENFATIRSVGDVVRRHYLSASTMTRWFKSYINSTPREYLESVRLAAAVNLLLCGESVTDACMKSGFSDCSHFIILFKRKFGKTPHQYKKQLKL